VVPLPFFSLCVIVFFFCTEAGFWIGRLLPVRPSLSFFVKLFLVEVLAFWFVAVVVFERRGVYWRSFVGGGVSSLVGYPPFFLCGAVDFVFDGFVVSSCGVFFCVSDLF